MLDMCDVCLYSGLWWYLVVAIAVGCDCALWQDHGLTIETVAKAQCYAACLNQVRCLYLYLQGNEIRI